MSRYQGTAKGQSKVQQVLTSDLFVPICLHGSLSLYCLPSFVFPVAVFAEPFVACLHLSTLAPNVTAPLQRKYFFSSFTLLDRADRHSIKWRGILFAFYLGLWPCTSSGDPAEEADVAILVQNLGLDVDMNITSLQRAETDQPRANVTSAQGPHTLVRQQVQIMVVVPCK